MEQKYFTVQQSNKSLIFVKPIVSDIMLKRKKMIEYKKTIRNIQLSKKEGLDAVLKELTVKLKNISTEITYHLEELESVGCYLKDFELGLIDFPSILNGKVVFLSWMHGEESVNYWHELTTGLEGRQLINAEFTTLTLEKSPNLIN